MISIKVFTRRSSGSYSEHIETVSEPGRLSFTLDQIHIAVPFDCGGRGLCGRCQIGILKKSNPLYPIWVQRKEISESEVKTHTSSLPVCQTILNESAILFVTLPAEKPAVLSSPLKQTENTARYGAAVDLGTTSIAAALLNLETGKRSSSVSIWNPQKRYGSDVISRLSAIAGNKTKTEECCRITQSAIIELLQTLTQKEGISLSQIERAAVAGNSVMSHFFLGIDAAPVTLPPYKPAQLTFPPLDAAKGGLALAPGAETITLPILTHLIGGDLTAGIFALKTNPEYGFTFGKSGPELLADIGTNGEMLLFTGSQIFAAQTAAGPVFEGAEISSGMKADPGAVIHLKIEGDTSVFTSTGTCDFSRFLCNTVQDIPPAGLAGSGLIDLAAELLRTGDLKPNGKLRGTVEINPSVSLTQKDVRAVQLAIGAIRAGMTVLLETAGIEKHQLKTFYAAGGLGSGITLQNARRLGLFPSELDSSQFVSCGNSSLEGAAALLRHPALTEMIDQLRSKTVHIQLAGNRRFEEEFIKGLTFP